MRERGLDTSYFVSISHDIFINDNHDHFRTLLTLINVNLFIFIDSKNIDLRD